MNVLPFPPYAPDISPFEDDQSTLIQNVFPRADGYGPVPSLSVYSQALPAACRGYFYARNNDGSVTIFTATSTRLWKMSNSDFSWTPVSKVTALTSISNASPAVLTKTAHGLSVGDAIVLSTTGALPTGLTAGTVYYVISAGFGANAFEVSTTPGGSAVNTSSAGSGTHSFTAQYTAVTSSDQWQFAQFNNFVFAVQINTVPQVYDLTSSTAFADLAGSPPQARYIAVVNRFVVLSGLGSSTPYRIQWSGLNATTTWTSGVNSSDFQDLPDGGIVRGVAGGESGFIMQDAAIRQMIYAPGSPVVFQIQRVAQDKGIFAPLSLVRGGDRVFFCGNDGFQMLQPGGYPQFIGKERVDRTFFADVDTGNLQLMIGAYDPKATRIYWAYKSLAGSAGLFDKILVYDFALDKWSLVTGISGEYLATLARPGLTLENLDNISGSIDALTFSLDDVSTNALAQLSVINSSHDLSFVSGSNLEATLDTTEEALDAERRVRVKGLRVISDAPTCYGSVGARETIQSTPTYSPEQLINAKGLCIANISTRMARGRLRIPAGTAWSFATGLDPMFAPEGRR
jgi:hypothetical protein